jgi:hypothetical protein
MKQDGGPSDGDVVDPLVELVDFLDVEFVA